MFGSRHDRFSEAKRLKALQIVADAPGISPRRLAVTARAKGMYSPRLPGPSNNKDRVFGNRILCELRKDGLVKRNRSSIKWGHETRYFLTARGTALLLSGNKRNEG
jgi:hypothetical protein